MKNLMVCLLSLGILVFSNVGAEEAWGTAYGNSEDYPGKGKKSWTERERSNPYKNWRKDS
jgi:hypothetical protein